MAEDTEPSLTDLLHRLEFLLDEPLDFLATNTETTLRKVQILTAAATYFNTLAVTDYGGRLGAVRHEGLLEQVVGAAFQTFENEDPHPEPFDKAAMLLRGITQGHPFNDGNKRTGFLTAAYYLDSVGYPVPPSLDVEAAEEFCLGVSAGRVRDVGEIAAALRGLWRGAGR